MVQLLSSKPGQGFGVFNIDRYCDRLMVLFVFFIFFPSYIMAQDCFDENGDCTLAGPVEFQVDLFAACGDTLELSPSAELCNFWQIPADVNFQTGEGADSSSIIVFIDQCYPQPIIVDGVTNTPSGGGIASCNTRIVYSILPNPDTLQQALSCGAFQALESTTETISSSCGCDSLVLEYTLLEVIDTTYLFASSCDPNDLGQSIDTLEASTGCDSILITTTELNPAPELFVEDQQACMGQSIFLDAITDFATTYEWSTGAQTSFIEVTQEGLYSVSVSDENGCMVTAQATASYHEIEVELAASVEEDFLLNSAPLEVWQGAALQLNASVTGTTYPYEIIWNYGPETGDTILNYIANESGELRVAAVDSIGCIGIETLELSVRPNTVFVPSAFSPDGDDVNDIFSIYTSPNIEETRLQIFSRTGNLVFDEILIHEIEQQGLIWKAWDGYFKNSLMLPQVFVYQLWYRGLRGEWEVIAGDVTLLR